MVEKAYKSNPREIEPVRLRVNSGLLAQIVAGGVVFETRQQKLRLPPPAKGAKRKAVAKMSAAEIRLREDEIDLRAFRERRREKGIPWEKVKADMKRRGLL